MLVHVAAMVCCKGLFLFIPTFLFLSIARINLINRDKLRNKESYLKPKIKKGVTYIFLAAKYRLLVVAG